MWCRAPDGRPVVLPCSNFTLSQCLCKAGAKTDPDLLYATSTDKLMVFTGSFQCSIRRRCPLSIFFNEESEFQRETCTLAGHALCTYKHLSKMDRDVYLMSIHRAASADCKLWHGKCGKVAATSDYWELTACLIQNIATINRSWRSFYEERNSPGVLWVPEGIGEDVVEPLALCGSSLDSTEPRALTGALYCWIIQESFTDDCKQGGPGGSLGENAQCLRRKLSISQIFTGLQASKGWQALLTDA